MSSEIEDDDGSTNAPVGMQTVWMHSLAVLQSKFGDVEVSPEDVSGVEAAVSTFIRLLSATSQPEQLEALAKLLAETWQNGHALPGFKV